MDSINSAWDETFLRFSRSASTLWSLAKRRWTSILSASMRRRVTADKRFLAARTMFPRRTELQGSWANSRAAADMTWINVIQEWSGNPNNKIYIALVICQLPFAVEGSENHFAIIWNSFERVLKAQTVTCEVIYYSLIFVIYWPPQFSWLRQLLRAFPVRFQGSPVRWLFPAQQSLPWLFQRLPPRRGPSWTCPSSSGETWTIPASSPASQQVWSIINLFVSVSDPWRRAFWAYTVPQTDPKPRLLRCFLNFRISETSTATPPGVLH